LTLNASRKFCLLLGVAGIAACSSFTVNMPAVTDAPTGQRLNGKIIWHDLLTDKPKASRNFYSELFGWEFEEVGIDLGVFRTVNYTLIRHEGELIGGMVDQTRLDDQAEDISQWVVLLSVEDIDTAVAGLEARGGKVFTRPTDLADRGRIAIVAGPQGALFAMLETKDGDPADRAPVVGGFLWDEVWVEDTGAASDFYRSLAEFDVEDKAVNDRTDYRYLSAGGHPRFGILPNPVEGLPPLWVTYIRVEDPDVILQRVEELGGEILLATQDRDLGGKVALIAGPSGAGIALQTWSPDNE
jgi:predicted enzyme related to lactoylglutathione lyase